MKSVAPLRVCLLVERNPKSWWAPHYVEAFKEFCDAVTVGTTPDFTPPQTDSERLLFEMVRPNDLELAEPTAQCLFESLPAGWHPQLIVAIQSCGALVQGLQQAGCPTAYITVDTWHDLNEYGNARHYDFVFVAQRAFLPYFRATGSARVFWLPLACSPRHHHPVPANKDFDIVFVGSTGQLMYEERIRRLAALGKCFSVATLKTFLREEACATSCRGKLVFNSSAFHDVNMRVFETLAMGCPLLTDADARDNGLFDLFEDGTHLIAYTDDDLIEKARMYLENEEAREAIARAGRAEVLARHTYAHRVAAIIDTVRRACPALDAASGPSRRGTADAWPYFPKIPGTVAVVGADLPTVGPPATRVIRVIPEGGPGIKEGPDSVPWAEMRTFAGRIDAVVASCWEGRGAGLGEVVAAAHEWLAEGGQLMLAVPVAALAVLGIDPTYDCLVAWFRRQGFHIVDLIQAPGADSEPACWIDARKRARGLREVCEEVYAKYPMTGLSLDELRAAVPEDL